jgi:hypothetical protein
MPQANDTGAPRCRRTSGERALEMCSRTNLIS